MANKITKKAQKYLDCFETKKRDVGETFVCLKDNDKPVKLHDSIRVAHGDKLPNDWTFGTYADLLQKITEYDLNTIEDLEDIRHEIVDGYVDVYTYQLTAWLAEDINNVNYITDALESEIEMREGFQLLALAQFMAIDEVMNEVVSLLSA